MTLPPKRCIACGTDFTPPTPVADFCHSCWNEKIIDKGMCPLGGTTATVQSPGTDKALVFCSCNKAGRHEPWGWNHQETMNHHLGTSVFMNATYEENPGERA